MTRSMYDFPLPRNQDAYVEGMKVGAVASHTPIEQRDGIRNFAIKVLTVNNEVGAETAKLPGFWAGVKDVMAAAKEIRDKVDHEFSHATTANTSIGENS